MTISRREILLGPLGERASDVAMLIDPSATMLAISASLGPADQDGGDLIGRCLWDFVHPDDADIGRAALEQTLATPESTATATFRFGDVGASWRWLDAVLTNRLADPDIAAVVCSARDVTERVTLEQALRASEARHVTATNTADEQLRVRALHDELTGLANRSLLADRLEHALARRKRPGGGPVAVIFADLDEFKQVNDSWGHAIGDKLLVQVAERLAGSAHSDDTVARFGGDEFVIVCEDTDEQQARRVADDLQVALRAPFDVDDRRVYVSASIGMAITPPDSAEELMRFADAAMYDAKARGRGRVQVFDVSLADEAADRLVMSGDLREALMRKQLTLDYQPVIDLHTGRLTALEALARWTHPRHGVVPPARFVAVAEATGLAGELGHWAIERATQELAHVRRAVGAQVRVAVNISARHVAEPDFESTVLAAMTAHHVPRDALLLEITESAVMIDPDQIRKVLERLRTRGIDSAIDDFGTGYSSLGNLSTLPVSTLKIDRSFIDRMTQDSDSLAIVASIVDLARIMNLATVAEGVETREQLTILRQLGCSSAQGFLWTKALPLEQLRQLMSKLPGGRFDVSLPGTTPRTRPTLPQDQVTVEHGLQQIMRMNKDGASPTSIAAALNAEGFRTPRGLRWHQATVGRVISECAYPHLWGADHE